MGVSGKNLKITNSDKGWIFKNVSAVCTPWCFLMLKPISPTATVMAGCIFSLGVPALSRSDCCIDNNCCLLRPREDLYSGHLQPSVGAGTLQSATQNKRGLLVI